MKNSSEKRTKDSGFTLILLLIFISVISEIIICMTDSMMMALKITKNFESYYRHLYLTDIALEAAKYDLLDNVIEEFSHWKIIEEPQLKNRETLKYKIEFLETIPCFQVENAEKNGADFFKIFALMQNGYEKIEIQATFVTAAKKSQPCRRHLKPIKQGYLTWKIVES